MSWRQATNQENGNTDAVTDRDTLVVTTTSTNMLCYLVGIWQRCPTYCPAPEPNAVSAGQEASMAKTLSEQILDARAEQLLARKDGAADWIAKIERELDSLLTQVPRTAQAKETAQ